MARLVKIEITNIKSIEDLKVNIDGNIIALKGKNGTGKTTFIQCLYALLKGNIPKSLAKVGTKNSSISGTFIVDDKEVKVNIELNKLTKNVSLYCDGLKVGSTIKSIKDFFKVNSLNFSQLLQKTQQAIKDEFFEALKYTSISEDVSVLSLELKQATDERKRLFRPMEDNRAYLKKITQSQDFIEKFNEPIDLENLNKKLRDADKHNNEIRLLENELYDFNNRINNLEKDNLDCHNTVKSLKEKIDNLRNEILTKEKTIEDNKLNIISLKEQKEQTERNIDSSNKIDTDHIVSKISNSHQHNENHNKVKQYNEQKITTKQSEDLYNVSNDNVWQIRSRLNALIDKLDLNLSFNEDEFLCYKGKVLLPTTISAGELTKLQVNFDIACNSDLLIMGIYNSDLLDNESKQEVVSYLLDLGYQVFIEKVEDNETLQVVIEDKTK